MTGAARSESGEGVLFYGEDAGNRYRLWYTENALHGTTESKAAPTRAINYAPEARKRPTQGFPTWHGQG